jgi:tripeptidyl-peptidase-1
MFTLKIVVVAAIAAFSNAAPPSIRHVIHERRQAPSLDWVKVARIEKTAILPIRIGLTQSNIDKGHDFLMEV